MSKYFPFDGALPTERTVKIHKGRHFHRPNKRRFAEKERRLAERHKKRRRSPKNR